jgi:hypothetical protein
VLLTTTGAAPGTTSYSLETFDPDTETFMARGAVCPGVRNLQPMVGVDSRGDVYVPYLGASGATSGLLGGLLRIDPLTMQCEATAFGPVGATTPLLGDILGMTFAAMTSASDKLYFIGNTTKEDGQPMYYLAAAETPDLQWKTIGFLPWTGYSAPLAGNATVFTQNANSALTDSGSGTVVDTIDVGSATLTPNWEVPPAVAMWNFPVPFVLWNGDFYFFTLFRPGPVTRASPDGTSWATVAETTHTVLAAATAPCAAGQK